MPYSDPKKRRKYLKQYKEKNKDKLRKQRKDKKYNSKHYWKHRDEELARTAKYAENNREKTLARYRKYNHTHKEQRKAYDKLHKIERKHQHRWRKYKLSKGQYYDLIERQDGKCAICRMKFDLTEQDWHTSPRVDHDHSTGEVRGLLCHSCNSGIGLLKESPKNMIKAFKYLTKHRR